MKHRDHSDCPKQLNKNSPRGKALGRREFLKGAVKVAALGSAAMATGCSADAFGSSEELQLKWKEYFKKNYRLMTQEEKEATVRRLERLAKLKKGVDIQMSSKGPIEDVLFGYAFNVSRCEGFMECVAACVNENNLDRKSKTQYIRIFEMDSRVRSKHRPQA